jgi:hypothetical protein
MQTVQLALADAGYAAALREALVRSGPWQVVYLQNPDPTGHCVVVMDEEAFCRLPLPLASPERVVLITRKDPQHLSRAWDAGIVSVVSVDDAPNTLLLAIMAAALRVPKAQAAPGTSRGISPNRSIPPAPISPEIDHSGPKRFKSR